MKINLSQHFMKGGITQNLLILLGMLLPVALFAQPATVSAPIAIGVAGCTNTIGQSMEFTFNGTTNTLANGSTCVPSLGTPGFNTSSASVAFNPADGFLYYIRFTGTPNSYVWRWNPRTCPTGSMPVYQTYLGQAIAGVAFDPNGDGWQINWSTTTAPFGLTLQKVNFTTGIIGAQQTITLPPGKNIWTQTGDIVYSPSGQLYFALNNKLFTVNHTNYGIGTLNATFIDTVELGVNQRLVGLGYSDGKLLASVRGPSQCFYRELNVLNGDTSVVKYTGNFSAQDLTSVISGIGAAKKLISAQPTGTPGVYDLEYDVIIRNYGNVPDSGVQVTDNLGTTFGAANVSNVSLSWPSGTPAGFTLNGAYNGTTNTNLLTNATPTTNILKAHPVAQNKFTVRISCRVSNIVTGTVYNNIAAVTATGYKNVALRDVSTNGLNPDLNTNDKPDDTGESQPTPFIVNVAAETPPCSVLKTTLYNQNFGAGTGLVATLPGNVQSQYTGSTTAPVPIEKYTLSNNANNGDPSRWISLPDHTGNTNGRMLLVNADVLDNKIFVDTVNVLCANLKYSFFTYASFIGNSTYQTFCDAFGGFKYPKLIFSVKNAATGTIITNATTGNITSGAWGQYGLKFVMPAGITKVIIEIYNAGEGGCGNDLALDDIQFGLCDPQPTVAASGPTAGCLGGSTTIAASLSDTTGLGTTLVYQWQSSPDGSTGWANVAGATSATYTINPLAAGDLKYYRLIVAQPGNIGNASCSYTSNAVQLTAKAASTVPTSATKNKTKICPGDAVSLRVNGGSLGVNATWRWYTGTCVGGSFVGAGTTITVNPTVTTTYFVRAEGDCNTTACVQVTVIVNCDIDDDNDGITDLAESNGTDPIDDDDFDGLENYRDPSYPGFIDTNTDGINDNFDTDLDGIIDELDLDSDNDGIPDVVETGGVDTDGDGKIDNYTDTDGDGLSQNVDANATGHTGSGTGLGTPDPDLDGVPNQIDLDSDNDGVPDLREVFGTDANNNGRIDGFTDTDLDGYSDNADPDIGNNGIAEAPTKALLRTGPDANNDGRADSHPYKNFDKDTSANAYDLDSDGDGLTDVREAGFTDANNNGMSDGVKGADGWDDAIFNTSYTIRNSDTDPVGQYSPDYLDIDADNDGIPDNIEGVSSSGYQFPLNLDSDGDGIDNRYDNLSGMFGGNGFTPNDQDSDGVPDYRDTDTDNDAVADIFEGNDYNLNGLQDDVVTVTGTDTDADGLDNRFDNDNTSSKGSSYYMGAGGGYTGDPSPGSNTMLQKFLPANADRDWRFLGYVLDINFLHFSGSRKGESVLLRWVITSDKIIDHFDIERSTDGTHFTKAGELKGRGTALQSTSFEYTDNLPGANGKVVYYRVKAVLPTGLSKSTQVISIHKQATAGISIAPNPAATFVTMNVNAVKDGIVEIQVMDAGGRMVVRQKQPVNNGSNSFAIEGVDRLTEGVYHIRVKMGEDWFYKKLIIQR